MKLADLLRAAVAAYTGFQVKDLQVHADPEVAGTYALRAVVGRAFGDVRVDFLLVGGGLPGGLRRACADADVDAVADALEEVEFGEWPPTSGAPKFF